MEVVSKNRLRHVLRFDPNDEVITSLRDFCIQHNVKGASFQGIGAAGEVLLSVYDLDKKLYFDKLFKGKFEITSLLGNVSKINGEVIVHAHGTFGDEHYNIFGGHIKKLTVNVTLELVLEIIEDGLVRRPDVNTDLNLLD